MITKGLLVTLVAKEGMEIQVEKFLEGCALLAECEPTTINWFALRQGPATFCVFDTFITEEGRDAHLCGTITKAILDNAAELFAALPKIEKVDVLGAK